jgi:hypothetical protein
MTLFLKSKRVLFLALGMVRLWCMTYLCFLIHQPFIPMLTVGLFFLFIGAKSSKPEPKPDAPTKAKIFVLGGEEPNEATVINASENSTVARMTFSSGSQTNSGFTPEKDAVMTVESAQANAVCRDLGDSFAALDMKKSSSQAKLEPGSSNNTPKKGSIPMQLKSPSIHKSASK